MEQMANTIFFLQIVHRPVFQVDDFFPVPLVHVDGVQVVHVLIPADGVHVGVQAVAHVEIIALEGLTLPLGQGVDHLCLGAGGLDAEADGAFHAVQVVVQAGGRFHEQGSGHTAEIQLAGQHVGEQTLGHADGQLGVIGIQSRAVALRDIYRIHRLSILLSLAVRKAHIVIVT